MKGTEKRGPRMLRWIFVAAFGIAVLGLVVLNATSSGHVKGRTVSSTPGFEIQSVFITRGTNHVLVYPSRLRYFAQQAYSALHLRGKRQWRFIPSPNGHAMRVDTEGEATVLWVDCKTPDGGHPLGTSKELLKTADGAEIKLPIPLFLWDAARNRLICAVPFTNSPANFAKDDVTINTRYGESTFQFR